MSLYVNKIQLMSKEDWRELHAAVKRGRKSIHRNLGFYTAALILFDAETFPERSEIESGSVALVKIGGHYFGLTAGHCALAASNRDLALTISDDKHQFRPKHVNAVGVKRGDASIDFGFLEFAPPDARKMEAKGQVFMAESRLEMLDSGQVDADANKQVVILAGFPRQKMETIDSDVPSYIVELWWYFTNATSSLQNPTDPAPEGLEAIDALVRPDRLRFPGMSGGGCWLLNPPPQPGDWEPSLMRLAGIYIGRVGKGVKQDGEDFEITRSVSIGHHLALIAKHYPDLRETIIAAFPGVIERFRTDWRS